jgi:hypothetical protein
MFYGLATVGFLVLAIFVYRQRSRAKARAIFYNDESARIGASLEKRSLESLGAYQHYFECGHPSDVSEPLLANNLIISLSTYKYGITRKGFEVGLRLGLFDNPHMVFPAD